MKVRNKRIYSNDQEMLATLRSEYIMLGFDTDLEQGCLTILSRKRKKKNKNEPRSKR